ncbi:hypothetical protein COOONC_00893, partial [Cooperia oncophora]
LLHCHFAERLLIYDGVGSLLSVLKRRKWAVSLAADREFIAKGTSLFSIEITLSTDGLSHVEEVISLVFNYIGLLRRSGVVAWFHEELRKISEIEFRFMEKDDPIHAAETLSSALQRIPFQDVLSCNVLMECKPARIMEVFKMLYPKNMFYIVSARKFSGQKGNIHEPICGIEMRIVDIDEATMKRFESALEAVNPAMRFPSRNNYIATKFDLKPRETMIR